MKLMFAIACIVAVSADVSHLTKFLPPTAQPEITQKYLPPHAQPEITQKYLPPPAQPEITQKYLPPISQPHITQKFVEPAVNPSFTSYPSTYSSVSLHSAPFNHVSTYAAPVPAVPLLSTYTAPTTFRHALVSPAVSYSSAPITPLSYTAPTYSHVSRQTTFHGVPALNPFRSHSNVYSGFDTAYNGGQVNLDTEYYAKPDYDYVHQPIVAQEPAVNYEPNVDYESTVVSAPEHNANMAYTYEKPESF